MSACILVIEDNAVNLELVQYLLERSGHTVLTACDGQVGLAVACAEQPDLIVCDIQMPVLDGFGVVKALKSDASLARIPIIAVTALSMAGDEQRMLGAGFDGYLSKPIEPQTFVGQVEAYLPGQRLTAN